MGLWKQNYFFLGGRSWRKSLFQVDCSNLSTGRMNGTCSGWGLMAKRFHSCAQNLTCSQSNLYLGFLWGNKRGMIAELLKSRFVLCLIWDKTTDEDEVTRLVLEYILPLFFLFVSTWHAVSVEFVWTINIFLNNIMNKCHILKSLDELLIIFFQVLIHLFIASYLNMTSKTSKIHAV